MATWDKFFDEVDVLVMPAAMTVAFPHCDTGSPVTVDGKSAPYFGQGALLAMGNLTGLPSLVAPAGQDEDGLPIGVQVVGPRWSERRLIAICRALETDGVLPGFVPPPEPVEI
jgi:amidase